MVKVCVVAEKGILCLGYPGSQMIRDGLDGVPLGGLLLQSNELLVGIDTIQSRQVYAVTGHLGEIEGVGSGAHVGVPLCIYVHPVGGVSSAEVVSWGSDGTTSARSVMSRDPA